MDDIVYSEILPDRFNDVIHHLRFNFFADEPLNKSVSLCQPGEPHEELEEFSLHVLKQGMSFMATLNGTGEVIGVILNGSESKQDHTENHNKSYKDKKLQKIFDFLGSWNNGIDISKEYNAEKILELKILSVDIRFRGKKIASRLFEVTEKFSKCKGFDLLRADATALFSQKLFERFGFTTIKEISYQDYPSKEDPWFNVEPPHVSFKVMIKKLN